MKEKRAYFAGVMHKNKFHVFGGAYYSGGWIRSKTTELISIDGGVEYGPELPEAVLQHAITSINSTVSLLSGDDGQDASYSTMGSSCLSTPWSSPINMALPPLWTR